MQTLFVKLKLLKCIWDGTKNVLTCLYDYTNFLQIYLLSNNSEIAQYLKNYVAEVEATWNFPVPKVCSDCGSEYNWAKSRGTWHFNENKHSLIQNNQLKFG